MARHLGSGARARHALLAAALVGTLVAASIAPQSATAAGADQLVVVDVTDGSTGDFSAASLRTVNTDGTKSFAAPVELPAADAAPVNAFALAGSSNGNGSLARSADGSYLAIAGYHHAPGGTGQVKSGVAVKPKDTKTADSADGPGIQRMVARVSSAGTVDTTTLLGTTALSGSHPRGVATDTGSSFYLSGNGGSTDTGVFSIPFGGGAKAAIAGSVTGEAAGDQKNTRNIQIAGAGLYTVSEKANLAGLGKVGTGLPAAKSTITRLGPKSPTADLPVPTAVVMLDANAAVDGIDAAYVSVDVDDNGTNDEIRKYTFDGTAWTANGTKSGDYPFLTARVSGGTVQLFASKGSTATGNTVVRFDDTNGAGAASFASDTTVATAAAGHAFRGLAFAPTGWNPGTISSSAPTASVAHSKVGGTIGDANNPGTTLTLADDDTDPADLTVATHSSDTDVIPDDGIDVSGTGLDRDVTFTPAGVGRATITLTVTDDNNNTGTAQVSYAASAAPTSASGRYFYESSDLSSAVDVGDGYAIAVSSEDNLVRLYKKDDSGRPVKTFDFTDASTGIGSTNADLESMARVNDTLYVLGSHGNNSSGDPKPSRRVLFTAAITGSGASTDLEYVGKDTSLWDDLRTWDQANGNRLGFADGQASGVPANNADGFNIEGFEFAPGSTDTGYLAFRAPLVDHDGKPSAVIVPVENLSPIMTGTLTFGDPIYLDLGGRTIREIRKNSDDEYLISASKFDAGSPQWKLYAWDGNPNNTPIVVKDLPDPDLTRTGSWESIVSVPHPLHDGGSATLISDSGDTTYYGDTTTGANESKGFRKSFVDEFTTDSYTDYPDAPATVTAAAGPGSIVVGWEAVAGAESYVVKVKTGSTETATSVNAPATSKTISGLTPGSTYSTSVSALNASGTSHATAGPDVTPQDVPFDPPSDLSSPSHTSSSVDLAWTKVPGATGYILSQGKGSDARTTKTVGDVSSASFTGLSASTAYTYDIVAVKGATQSSASTPRLTVTTSAETVPTDRPTDVRWTSRTASAITVAWTKKPGSAKYKIRWTPTGSKTYTYLTVGNVSSAQVTGLSRGASYNFKVAAITSSGTVSPYSTPALTASTSNLKAPTNFVKKSSTATTITLTWTKSVGAEAYSVAYGLGDTGARTYVNVAGGDTQTVKITGLTAGKKYTLAIASTELGGTSRSSYTPRISVTTPAS